MGRRIFHEADEADGESTGSMTWPKLKAHLRDKRVRAVFSIIGLEFWDLRLFFEMLAKNRDASAYDTDVAIGIDEFVFMCLRLGGTAKNADLNAIKYELSTVNRLTER